MHPYFSPRNAATPARPTAPHEPICLPFQPFRYIHNRGLISRICLAGAATACVPDPAAHAPTATPCSHSPHTPQAPNNSTQAIEINAPAVQYGFLGPDDGIDPKSWPRRCRLADGSVVRVGLVKRGPKEENPLLLDGPLLTYVQICGELRGKLKGSVCLVCLKRMTSAKGANSGTKNNRDHLKTGKAGRSTGCKQPDGLDRLAQLDAKQPARPTYEEPEWTFEEKLPHHVDVAFWLVDNARPEHICKGELPRQHEREISGGKYNLPSPPVIDRLQQITEKLTFENVFQALLRARNFNYGAAPWLAVCYNSWTSNANDTYISLEASLYEPGPAGLQP